MALKLTRAGPVKFFKVAGIETGLDGTGNTNQIENHGAT
jgi:hypothetical protein